MYWTQEIVKESLENWMTKVKEEIEVTKTSGVLEVSFAHKLW